MATPTGVRPTNKQFLGNTKKGGSGPLQREDPAFVTSEHALSGCDSHSRFAFPPNRSAELGVAGLEYRHQSVDGPAHHGFPQQGGAHQLAGWCGWGSDDCEGSEANNAPGRASCGRTKAIDRSAHAESEVPSRCSLGRATAGGIGRGGGGCRAGSGSADGVPSRSEGPKADRAASQKAQPFQALARPLAAGPRTVKVEGQHAPASVGLF